MNNSIYVFYWSHWGPQRKCTLIVKQPLTTLTWNSDGRRKVGCPELRGGRLCRHGRRKGKVAMEILEWRLMSGSLLQDLRARGPAGRGREGLCRYYKYITYINLGSHCLYFKIYIEKNYLLTCFWSVKKHPVHMCLLCQIPTKCHGLCCRILHVWHRYAPNLVKFVIFVEKGVIKNGNMLKWGSQGTAERAWKGKGRTSPYPFSRWVPPPPPPMRIQHKWLMGRYASCHCRHVHCIDYSTDIVQSRPYERLFFIRARASGIKDLRGNPKPRVSPDRTGPNRNRSGVEEHF